MIEVFDEKDVEECPSEVKDSDIKTYAFCLLDWAIQKRKVQAIPLDKVKKAKEEIDAQCGKRGLDDYDYCSGLIFARNILDKLIESEE